MAIRYFRYQGSKEHIVDTIIVFLGSYSEYDELINNFKDRNNLNVIKIWHPAYLIRSYSENKYLKWIKNLEGKLI